MTRTKEIQREIKNLLNSKLTGENVSAIEEWNIAKNSNDDLNFKTHYSPRVDVAAGPFMINRGTPVELEKLNNAFNDNKILIEEIKSNGETFNDLNQSNNPTISTRSNNFSYNENPRCLIAIEIEHSGQGKHLIGDITNASILGKIGLIVPTTEAKYRSFQRIMKYLEFAQTNEKMRNNVFNNIILIKSEKLIETLERFQNNSTSIEVHNE